MNGNTLQQKIQKFVVNIHNLPYIAQQIGTISGLNVTSRDRGLNGIENTGNTCYMNSILQCLRHTALLNNHLLTHQTQKMLMKNFVENPNNGRELLMLVKYIKIINIMWNHNKIKLTPLSFKILLNINFEQFANSGQHDAHELLVTLLQSFHESLSKNVRYCITGTIVSDIDTHTKKAHEDWITYYKNKHSIILDLFSSQLRTDVTCLNCQKTSYTFDPLMIIDLPMTSNIYHSLDQFTATEQFSEDNLYQCEQCHSRTRASKRQTLWSLPNLLIIKFNRFQYTSRDDRYILEKICGCVTYPIKDLELSKYLSPPLIRQTFYDLYAVCCHQGTMNSGHYYAICYNEIIQAWVQYSDEHIREITDSAEVVSNDSYILFYKKKT